MNYSIQQAGAAIAWLALGGCASAVGARDASSAPDGDATAVVDAPMRSCPIPSAPGDAARGDPQPGRTEAAVRSAATTALLRVTQVEEECSGAGGTHVTFAVVAFGCSSGLASAAAVGLGGHAFYPRPALAPGALVVAGLGPNAEPRAPNPGWCLTGLPAVQADVVAYVDVADEATGRATLARLSAGP